MSSLRKGKGDRPTTVGQTFRVFFYLVSLAPKEPHSVFEPGVHPTSELLDHIGRIIITISLSSKAIIAQNNEVLPLITPFEPSLVSGAQLDLVGLGSCIPLRLSGPDQSGATFGVRIWGCVRGRGGGEWRWRRRCGV
ncbi:unnamed protein product [Orchesella dallaii]|uniref:Uncharacterized protein n=1 Tax=Orchesella dallaii TaxID=48710 RepID=A0ABP1S0C9_9HEXA